MILMFHTVGLQSVVLSFHDNSRATMKDLSQVLDKHAKTEAISKPWVHSNIYFFPIKQHHLDTTTQAFNLKKNLFNWSFPYIVYKSLFWFNIIIWT